MVSRTTLRLGGFTLLCCVTCLLVGCRRAGGASSELTSDLAGKLEGKHWYRVSVMGQASGWAFFENWTRRAADGSLQLVSRQRLHFSIVLNGRRLTAAQEMTIETDVRLRPVSIAMAADELGRPKNVKAEVRGDRLEVTVEGGKQVFTKSLPLPEDWGSDLQLELEAAAGRLQPGRKLTASIFDPQLVDFDRHYLEVKAWREMEIGGQKRRLLQIDDRTEKLKLSITTYIDEEGVMWRQEVPGIMNMVLEKVSEEEAKELGQPLSLTNRVEIDKALGDPRGLRLLVLLAKLEQEGEAPFPTTERQEVTSTEDKNSYRLTLRAAKPPAKIAAFPRQVPSDLLPLTQATSLAQADDARMKQQALEIVAGSKDSWEAARAIVQWVYENMRKVASEPRPVTALESLEDLVGDCTEHAVLAGTLARAVGLPSKMCVGLGYTGDAFYYHAWVRIWVGEWVEMDPTWGEDTVDASHIEIAEGSLDEMSLAQMSLATARVIGQVEFKVLKMERGQ